MTDAEQIAVIKSNTLATIAEITAEPRPNYEVDGLRYDWADYLEKLQRTVAWCDQQLAAVSPVEIVSRGIT